MCPKIETDFVKVKVTALKFLGDRLFAGVGGDLCVFDVNLREAVYRKNVLGTRTVHGICSNDDVSFIGVYGGRNIAILECSYEESSVKYNLSSEFVAEDWIWWVEWMNDNSCLVMIDAHNVLTLWNWPSGVKIDSFKCEEKCILYSAKIIGKEWSDLVVLTGTVFQEIVIWSTDDEMRSGEDRPVLHRLYGHKGVIFSVNYNSNSRRICSTSDDRSVRVWKVESSVPGLLAAKDWKDVTIQLLFSVFGHKARVFRSCLLNDEKIISVGEDSQLCIWNGEGKCVSQRQCHQGGVIWSVDCNEELALIATGGSDGGISIWCLETSRAVPVEFPSTGDEPRSLAILSKQKLVVITESGYVKINHNNVWMDIWRDDCIAKYCLLEVSPNRSLIGLAMIDGLVCILKYTEDNVVRPLEIIIYEQVIVGRIFSLIWLNDEQFLISGPNGHFCLVLILLSEAGGTLAIGPTYKLPAPCKECWVTAAAIVLNRLMCGDRDGNIHLYCLDGELCETLRYIHGHNGVTCLRSFNNRIWSTGRDGTLRQYMLFYRSPVSTQHANASVRFVELHELVADKLTMQWVADIVSSRDDILVVGFHDKSCVVWSAKERNIVVSLPCGGGHRSWDVVLNSDVLEFAFIKDKRAHMFSSSIQHIYTPALLEGFHTNEINCMKNLTSNDGVWVISGGEDNTVRFSHYKDSKWKTKSVVRSHWSSVRTIATASVSYGDFVFTAGGRSQIKAWKVVQHSEDDVLLTEVDSLLNKVESASPWHQVIPSNEPEPRYMDISVSVESDDDIFLYVVTADSVIRKFWFKADISKLIPWRDSLYSDRCLLKVFIMKVSSRCKILCTTATDGKLAFWDPNKIGGTYRPFSVLNLHQSGINACDWVALSANKILLISGGDDSTILCTVLYFTTDRALSVVKGEEQSFRSGHISNITGIKIWKDLIISSGTDQRVCIFKWSVKSGVDVTLVNQCTSVVADVHGIDAWSSVEDRLTVCVYGIGFEVFSITYSADGDC